uniref:Calcineurin-like phosphoesterase domain-containing protein n=1 Tax=Quercus lobata TaxID=97700 RepID=A0A7N2KRW9_QUELO
MISLYLSLTVNNSSLHCPPRVDQIVGFDNCPISTFLKSLGVALASTSSKSSPTRPSDEISLIYSCWVTFIGLYIANYVAEGSSESGEEYKKNKRQTKPDFLDMVPWYSGTSADLYKTVFDLIISAKVFLSRFDLRMYQTVRKQNSEGETQRDYLHDDFSTKEELWFDFMADTGDGGNSTYTVARPLAQRKIKIESDTLKRGDLLLIGGDLAYPNPSKLTYERRMFRPFKYALQQPPSPVDTHADYAVPRCFAIPGNHDWFDGLDTFTKNICHGDWLGGWFLPQKTSYFALKLPMGWWIFGLDLALHSAIDNYQLDFFSKLAEEKYFLPVLHLRVSFSLFGVVTCLINPYIRVVGKSWIVWYEYGLASIRGAPSRGSSDPTAADENHNPSAIPTISISSAILPQSDMFEAWVGMKGLHPPQRHRILSILKVVWSGQGRHRFKTVLRFDKGEMVFLSLSVKIRSRYWSHQILGASEARFFSISAVCFIAGVITWRLINFRLPAPFLQRCWLQDGFPAPFLQQR